MQRLDIYFHFQRGILGSPQQQNDSKTCEIKQEHQETGGKNGGAQQGKRHFPQQAQWRSTQNPPCVFQARIQLCPGSPYHADDNGGVVKYMCQ